MKSMPEVNSKGREGACMPFLFPANGIYHLFLKIASEARETILRGAVEMEFLGQQRRSQIL